MKTMMKAGAFLALGMLLMGCVRENMEGTGKTVKFRARTEMSTITRTSYSGDINATTNIERIDWENNDRIRIVSDVASTYTNADYSDYDLTLTSNSGKFSYASAEPHGSANGLRWGSGTNTFYACYPSPTTTSSGIQNNLVLSYANGGAEFTAVIPADQSAGTHTGSVSNPDTYYGNMNLAYMLAAATGTESGGDITLSFTPIVTTFYVTVQNNTGSPMTLQRVALSSSSVPLTGTYKARMTNVHSLDSDHNPRNYTLTYSYLSGNTYVPSIARDAGNSTIYASFSNKTLAVGESIIVSLFALPQDNVVNLTLSVTSAETGTVSLPLTYGGSTISFTREHKHNISNVGVPTVTYAISVEDASGNTVSNVEYDKTGVAGTDQTFYVRSTKTIGGVSYAAPWKAQVKVNGQWADMDATNRPSWLSTYPLTSADVTGIPQSGTNAGRGEVQRNVSAQPVISHVQRLKEGKIYTDRNHTTEVDNSTAANAVDLSYYNFETRSMENTQYTANTYIISKPGWYKFPCVYGNAIENNATAGDSYRGRLFLANHLDRFKKMNDFSIYTRGPWLEMHGLVNYHRYTELVWQKWTVWDSNSNQAVTSGKNSHQSPSISYGPDANVDVIKNLDYENGAYNISQAYVIFYVDPDNIRPGNAVIATKENTVLGEDKITWSWQIWITDQEMTPVNVTNGTETYNVMPVNLGWVDDQEGQHYPEVSDEIRFVNMADGVERCRTGAVEIEQPELDDISTSGWQTYYQWGRKDPFSKDVTVSTSGDHLLYKSIQRPDVMFYEESTEDGVHYIDWTSANYDNLWDSKCTTYGTPGGALPNHKTVYDPSPRRYCVSPDNAWNGFANNRYGHKGYFARGYYFYTGDPSSPSTKTLFFPASGYVNYNSPSCAITDESVGGFYWTYHATTNTQTRVSYALRFEGGNAPSVNPVYSTMTHRASGYSVRPVVYDETQVTTVSDGTTEASINLTQQTWTSPNDLRNEPAKDISLAPSITVEFGKSNGLSTNLPKYNSSLPAVVLDSNNSITITSHDLTHPMVQIELIFAEDNPESHTLSVSSTSSGTNGYYSYDSEGNRGEWVSRTATPNYANSPVTWTGGETQVVFSTNTSTGNGLYLTGIVVHYY